MQAQLQESRDAYKRLQKERLELAGNLNQVQNHELTRLNELEGKFAEVSQKYIGAKEEISQMRVKEIALRSQITELTQARQNFKEQLLEAREANKDFKRKL